MSGCLVSLPMSGNGLKRFVAPGFVYRASSRIASLRIMLFCSSRLPKARSSARRAFIQSRRAATSVERARAQKAWSCTIMKFVLVAFCFGLDQTEPAGR